MNIKDLFSNTLPTFTIQTHTDSKYTHIHWDMKWISLWISNKITSFYSLMKVWAKHYQLVFICLFYRSVAKNLNRALKLFLPVHRLLISISLMLCLTLSSWLLYSLYFMNPQLTSDRSRQPPCNSWTFSVQTLWHCGLSWGLNKWKYNMISPMDELSRVLRRQAVSIPPLAFQHCKNRANM